MNDNIVPRRPIVPAITPTNNGHANNAAPGTSRPKPVSPSQYTTTTVRATPSTTNPHNVILAAHPQDNEIAGSVNIRYEIINHILYAFNQYVSLILFLDRINRQM